jgi:hypothetical protein
MPMSLEVINRSAILLHIPDDHGNAVYSRVTLGWSRGSGSPQSRERNIAGHSGDGPVGERSESCRSWNTLVFEFRIYRWYGSAGERSKYTRFTALRLGKVDSKLGTLRSFQKGSDS